MASRSKPEMISFRDLMDIVEEIRRALRGKVSQAYVFGSVASGTAIPMESDFDLLIIPRDRAEDFYQVLKHPYKMLLDLGLNLHVIVYDPVRHGGRILREVREKGIRII